MDVESKLKDLPAWRREGDEIRRSVNAPDFPTAIRIVDEIAVRAEELDHHPDIDIRWRTLHLALTTHDQGGLTERDFTLAAIIDDIAARHGA
ncbi:4a-hydroxytetrahydrobiopterin dehydratase [Nonomuraea sp. NPDC050783]|uniref:4a-hydroxytetrahydrobiopterin dehydratase n=1 Tax=Nonomuraea sp. NPDC050783 TaxID=3154634 RepID=UPI00346524DF